MKDVKIKNSAQVESLKKANWVLREQATTLHADLKRLREANQRLNGGSRPAPGFVSEQHMDALCQNRELITRAIAAEKLADRYKQRVTEIRAAWKELNFPVCCILKRHEVEADKMKKLRERIWGFLHE